MNSDYKRREQRYQWLERLSLDKHHDYRALQRLVKDSDAPNKPKLTSSRGTLIEWLVKDSTRKGIDLKHINQM